MNRYGISETSTPLTIINRLELDCVKQVPRPGIQQRLQDLENHMIRFAWLLLLFLYLFFSSAGNTRGTWEAPNARTRTTAKTAECSISPLATTKECGVGFFFSSSSFSTLIEAAAPAAPPPTTAKPALENVKLDVGRAELDEFLSDVKEEDETENNETANIPASDPIGWYW